MQMDVLRLGCLDKIVLIKSEKESPYSTKEEMSGCPTSDFLSKICLEKTAFKPSVLFKLTPEQTP